MRKNIFITLGIVIIITLISVIYFKKTPSTKTNNSALTATSTETSGDPQYIIVSSRVSEKNGKYLTDSKGRTLYVFADDKDFQSNCYDDCLTKWPIYEYNNLYLAYVTDPLSKYMGVTIRKDKWQQYSYQRKPVYYYIGDKKPGDTNGVDDSVVGSKWSLILLK